MGKKVVFVAEDIDCVGGVQKFIDVLARSLTRRGYEVSLLGRYEGLEKAGFDRTGINVDTVFSPPIKPHLDILASSHSSAEAKVEAKAQIKQIETRGRAKLTALIRTWGPDTTLIVVQVGVLAELVACGLNLETESRPKVIAQYHGTFEYAKKQRYFPILKSLYPKADISLFLTAEDVQRFEKEGLSNARLMVNGVERAPAGGMKKNYNSKTVVSLGRYAEEKSLDEMIRAWAILAPRFPDWTLELYGSGPMEQSLSNQIRAAGLSRSVKLCGLASDVPSVLRSASVNVMTSHKEGFPVSLLEASVWGVPSVAFDAGPSTSEIIRDGESGYVVDDYSVEDFAFQLGHLMTDQALRRQFGIRAYELSARYDSERILDQWETLFKEIGSGGKDLTETTKTLRENASSPPSIILPVKAKEQTMYSHTLRTRSKALSLRIETQDDSIKHKDFALVVRLYDRNDDEINAEEITLPWSSMLQGCYVYSPRPAFGFLQLPLIKSKVPVARFTIGAVPWGKKTKSPDCLDNLLVESWSVNGRQRWLTLDVVEPIRGGK